MIKLRIIAIGKDKDRWISAGCEHCVKLLKRFATVELKIIPSPKISPSMTPDEIMKKEAERIVKQMSRGVNIALVDSGRQMDSIAFSSWLRKQIDTGDGPVNFVIGGPYGLHESILSQASETISLSALTFSHQLVRLVLLEQLYRALSIAHGTDYHK